ncbi:MAG: lysine--tRNA ligase [Candidatus Omnitrophica bacterium CG1_02_49_10]|nr:MAG: lysine--tRNA ligase [Candidatus Omnitrophica bacterium CG1_02_49_10]
MANNDDTIKSREDKLSAIISCGVSPYGGRFDGRSSIDEIKKDFVEGKPLRLAGRLMAIRSHGKGVFADLRDSSGRMQLYIKADVVGEEQFSLFDNLDIGDIIGVDGESFMTRTGEPTLKVEKFQILSKSLKPLPEKWHGLKDVETRYRQRHLDLIANESVKNDFLLRSRLIKYIRSFLDGKGFIEVETPMMHQMPGGAAGEPFKTHHKAHDIDLYLRLAPELYLKKLLVGGFEKVYELNRSFRNEGISTKHNPEFTMLEVYAAYCDYKDMMSLVQELIRSLAVDILGSEKINYQGKEIDLSGEWDVVSFAELMKSNFGIDADDDDQTWIAKLRKKGKTVDSAVAGKGRLSRSQILKITEELLDVKASSKPVFVIDYFKELCPLDKRKKDNPSLTERFELFIGGMEVANAYSELNDPREQMERFREQAKELGKSEEAIDKDFVGALEYGMPPAGGLGVGIDRLTMLLADKPSIRDVILFPQLKPEIPE